VKLLLDTHLLLWAAGQPDRLSQAARELVENKENELIFSTASLWEVVIKRGLGRDDLKVDPRLLRRGLLDNGYSELPISSEHVVALERSERSLSAAAARNEEQRVAEVATRGNTLTGVCPSWRLGWCYG
jgi:PIN domain nuclease of toxin-antitoxin system